MLLFSSRARAGGTLAGVTVTFDTATQKYTRVNTYTNPASQTTTSGSGSSVDVSDAIAASASVALTDIQAKVVLTTAASTYTGLISGTGTLDITQAVNPSAASGSGSTLVTGSSDGGVNPVANGAALSITQVHTLELPSSAAVESTASENGVWTVTGTNPPVVTIAPGVTLVYEGSANFALIDNSGQINFDNILNNGVLQVAGAGNTLLGAVSGTGSILAANFALHGTSLLTGVVDNEVGVYYGDSRVATSLPNVRAVINNGSLLVSSEPGGSLLTTQNIYESHFGSDINTDTGLNIFSGIDSYSNNTSRGRSNLVNPGLVDPTSEGTKVTGTIGLSGNPTELNMMYVQSSGANFTQLNYTNANNTQAGALGAGGNSSYRGINIEGGITQWGDGTTNSFFLPAMPDNSYINLHNGATLRFDYTGKGGPVVLNTPIGGGTIGAPLQSPGNGNVEVMNPSGGQNVVIFAQPAFYHGTTTIDVGAELQLGLGKPTLTYSQSFELEQDNSINYDPPEVTSTYSADCVFPFPINKADSGAYVDGIVNNGTLVANNTENQVVLQNVSGSGKVVQQGVPNSAVASGTPETKSGLSMLMALLPGTLHPEVPALVLAGTNVYTGGTSIARGSTLVVASERALGLKTGTTGGDVANAGLLARYGSFVASSSEDGGAARDASIDATLAGGTASDNDLSASTGLIVVPGNYVQASN